MSGSPPAVAGTTSLMGRVGKLALSCAIAASDMPHSAAMQMNRATCSFMKFSFGDGDQRAASSRIRSTAFSPMAIEGALVSAEGMVGITEASAMRRPGTPRTFRRAST